VAEPVERRLQVGIEHPQPLGELAARRDVDGHDRVMAAAAGPESVGLRLEPGLPFRLQRTQRQRLKGPVGDHGYAEPATAPVALGHIHPPHRQGPPRGRAVLQPGGHGGLIPAGEHDAPVDPGCAAASVDLRHPPHADQRAATGPEHQLLQVTDPFQVPGLRRREDPLPQPPYVLLGPAPVHLVPVRETALRSVHPGSPGRHRARVCCHRRPTCPSVPASRLALLRRLTRPASAPFRAGAPAPIRPVMREPLAEEPAPGSRFPAAFRPPAFASRAFLRPPGYSASLTVGLPAHTTCRTPSGLSRSACVRDGRGGCPLYPGDGGALPAGNDQPAGTCRLPAAGPYLPLPHPTSGSHS
jgi:hypothetical protein